MIKTAAHRTLAAHARQAFAQYVEKGLPVVVARISESAKVLASQPSAPALAQQRVDVVRALTVDLAGWSSLILQEVRSAQEGGAATRFAKALPRADQGDISDLLGLVDDSTIKHEILASRLALAMMDRVNWEFSDLRARLVMLEQRAELDERDMLRPHVLAMMIVEAWKNFGLSLEAWRDLQAPLREEFTNLFEEAYHEANRWLVEQGVMPEIDLRPLIRRTRSSPATGPADASTAFFDVDQAAHHGPSGSAPGSNIPSSTVSSRGAVNASSMPGDLPPPDWRAKQVIDRLSGLVAAGGAPGREVSPPFSATVQQPMVSPGLSQAMQAAQGAWVKRPQSSAQVSALYTAPLMMQEIELQKHDLKRAAGTQEERTTIEIVALLFQTILTEERLPPGMRVWFARLQMPVLRVAVTEPDFFATLDHPARRLIDRMGACVMGFGGEGPVVDEALEVEIKRIVQVVEAYPDTGRRVFQTVLNEFEKFLESYFREQNPLSRNGVSLAQQLEQREALAIQYTIELRRMLEEMPVQEGVRQFLFDVWADVLATVAVSQGTSGEQARAMKRVAADLIWSAGAKVTREERANVLRRLPALLRSLREGMSAAGIVATRQEEVIKQLNDSLTAGFTAKAARIPQRQLHDLMEQLESLEEMMPEVADVEIDESIVREMPGSFGSGLEVVTSGGEEPMPVMVAWARELQVGSWFMLQQEGAPAPLQLVWHGLRKQLSLFVAPDGVCKVFQQNRLAAYLQAGLLQPAQDEALTVRAIRAALDQLQAQPERLLS